MSSKTNVTSKKGGIRSRLFICILEDNNDGYSFTFSNNPYCNIRIHYRGAVCIGSYDNALGNCFAEMIMRPFAKKGSISWQEIPVFTKFRALGGSLFQISALKIWQHI